MDGNTMDRPVADALLAYTREVLMHELRGGQPPSSPPTLTEIPHGGAFVTLMRGGRLRGCMGTFHPCETLAETVESAARSALHDPRFADHPVTADELAEVQVELSIVTLPTRTERPESLEIGRHGIWIRRGSATGCFLPHVAVERHLSAAEFLSLCCSTKAGLAPDAWRDPQTDVLLFEAQVLAE